MTETFHAFEHAGWERAAEQYADAFGDLTSQAADPLLDAVGAGAGVRVLDVASGPGFVARHASARGALVTGIDFSPAMIAEARRRHPAIPFHEGNAAALPFDAGSFDAVVMNFGMLHLARPEAAIAEARRVLRPGGRYGFTVWADPSLAVGFGIVLGAIERWGNKDVPLPEGPPFFRFASASESRRALEDAAFEEVDVRPIALVWRLSSSDGVFDALSRGGVRTAAVLRAQTSEALTAIRRAVGAEVERYARGRGFAVPMPAVLTVGTAR